MAHGRALVLVTGRVQAAHNLVQAAGQVLGQEALTLTPASLVLVAPSQVHPTPSQSQAIPSQVHPTRYQAARNLVLAVARGRALVLVTGQIPGPKVLSQVHPTPTQVRTPELDRRTLAVGLIRTQGNQR